MAFPTYAVSTELDAVNQILSSVGQAPVTTLDLQNPEVSIVLNTLREVSKQCQSEGWLFNVERYVTLIPDTTTKEIKYPPNALQIDVSNNKHNNKYDVVKRGVRLYDRIKHSFIFEESITVDITYYFEFFDIPAAIQNYITARAARMCAVKMIGDKEVNALLQEQEIMTRATALEYDLNQGDISFFGFENGQSSYQSYQPFHALKR